MLIITSSISAQAYSMLSTQSTTTGFDYTVECADGRVVKAKMFGGRIHAGGKIYDDFNSAMAGMNCE